MGQVDVYLTNKGQALIDVQVGLELKGIFEATGALEIEADPQTGINLNSLKFTIPEAGLEGIFTVKKASFVYYFPSDARRIQARHLAGQGRNHLRAARRTGPGSRTGVQERPVPLGLARVRGAAPRLPIYPGIFLNKLGGSIGVEPFSFGGVLGAKIAETFELTLAFKYREASGEELGFFGGQGELELGEDKIATLAADVYSDGYVDAQLNIDLQLSPSPRKNRS